MASVVRRATVDDIDELMRLRLVMSDALGETPALAGEWSVHAVDDLRERLPSDEDLAVLVVDGPAAGVLVASAYGVIHPNPATPLRPDGRVGYVFGVVTEPDHRGHGLATSMMTAMVAWFTERGVTRVELEASPSAERLYERLGFERIDEPGYVLTITARSG